MRDEHRVDGRRSNPAAPSNEADRFGPALPALAGSAFGWRRGIGCPDCHRHRSEHSQRARLVCYLATFQRTSSTAKSLGGEATPGPSSFGARLGPGATAGRTGQGPAGAWLRGDELDRATPGHAPAPTLPAAHQRPHLAPSLAGGGAALEATAFRLCRTRPARRPEKGHSSVR